MIEDTASATAPPTDPAQYGSLTREALHENTRITKTNLLRLEASEPFFQGTMPITEPEAVHAS